MKPFIKISLIILFSLLIVWFLIRLISPREIDDVSPGIPCENEKEYIEKSKYLWVIPLVNNVSISENKIWCDEILAMNKTLGLHGVFHSPYREFKTTKNQEYLDKGISEFEKCFGYKPEMFKPPQLHINKENKNLIKQNDLISKYRFNQAIRKVYHCNDSGILNNKIIDIF